MELIMCIFTQERKDPSQKIIKKEILNNENFVLIKECSWYGCGLEFSNLRPVLKKARFGNTTHFVVMIVICIKDALLLSVRLNTLQ